MPNPESAERLTYTIKEVSKILGVPISTVYETVRRGDFPSVKFGRKVLVPKLAVDAMLKRGDKRCFAAQAADTTRDDIKTAALRDALRAFLGIKD